MSIELNTEQLEAIQKLSIFLDSDQKYFLLTGSAGTGKTSVIVSFLSSLPKKKIAFSATTNKAVSVLEDMMNTRLVDSKLRKNITFLTIHKLLKVKRRIGADGKEIYATTIDEEIPLQLINCKSIYGYDIIVIDEISMMSMGLIEKLLTIKDRLNGKIIFVGDGAQLPPINEKSSYVFNLKIPTYQLNTIVRNGGNMLKLSNQVRGLVLKNKNINLVKLADENVKLYRIKDVWVDKYISQVAKIFKKIKNGQTTLGEAQLPIMLTYTNKSCQTINDKVRNVLFNNPKDKYVNGDIIVFNNFYNLPSNGRKYYTSQQAHITSVVVENYCIKNLNSLDIINIRTRIKDLSTTDENVMQKYLGKEDDMCGICLETKDPETLTVTICKHIFCKNCFKAWFKISETCPLCRMDFKQNSIIFNDDSGLTQIIGDLQKATSDKQYKIWLLNTSENDTIMCIHEDSRKAYDEDIEIIKVKLLKLKKRIDRKYKKDLLFMNSILTRLWDFYYFQFIDQFADIIYGYAITTHKSQGSTYHNVYIEMSDIIHNNPNDKNSHQCLYTAITRASGKLKIFY